VEPVRREALPTVIAEQIQRFILEEGLQSGDPLPSERELLAQLGVSRSSLREALTALEMMGWLRSQQGRRRVVAVPQSFAEGLDHERLVELVRYEAIQAAQEGRQVDGLSLELDGLRQASREELERLLGRLGQAPIRADFPYVEPDDLPTILAEAGGPEGEAAAKPAGPLTLRPEELIDRLAGAWYGRVAGCMLGRPVELWSRAAIERYLKRAHAWPLRDYLPYKPEATSPDFALPPAVRRACKGHLHGAIRDDDLDFTVLNLLLLERHGPQFTTAHVAETWLHFLAFRNVYTAEEVTYRNLVQGVPAPVAGGYRNPFREWVGARIRADLFGYVQPGRPQAAAAMAYRDAVLSHRKNGVYAAMAVAAMVAQALVGSDLEAVLAAGRAVIPARSRLAEAIRLVEELAGQGASWEEAVAEVEARFAGYSEIHALPNEAIVWLALIYGEGEYTASITLATLAGQDTDCNAATVGSIVGALNGFSALPGHWLEPLADTLEVALAGHGALRISDLVERTWQVARRLVGGEPTAAEERQPV